MNGIKGANKPKISIIMPVYNAEKWLDKSIVSVLKQSYFKNHQKIWNIVKEDLLRLNVYDEKRFNLMRFVSAMWDFSFNPLSSRDKYLYIKDMIQDWNLTKDDFKKYNLDCYSKYKKIKKYPYWILFLKYKIFMRKK